MSKGVIIYGINNSNIDYVNLAIMNAKLVAAIMKVPVSLITNEESSTHPNIAKSGIFDQVIIDSTSGSQNNRTYRDTIYHTLTCDFKNYGRPSAYALSPYEETILLDSDYLIQSDILNQCWGSAEDVLINYDAIGLDGTPLDGDEYRLNIFGIRMVWATVVYFKKCSFAKTLFDMVAHVKDHWEFYQLVYNFPNVMYRNDYAFAIALHTMNGFLENNLVKPLPVPYILTATDKDQLYSVGKRVLSFFVNDRDENYRFYVCNTKEENIHCMNKISLLRHLNQLGDMYV